MQEGRLGVLHTVLQRLAASLCKNPPLPPLKRLHQFCPKMYAVFAENVCNLLAKSHRLFGTIDRQQVEKPNILLGKFGVAQILQGCSNRKKNERRDTENGE